MARGRGESLQIERKRYQKIAVRRIALLAELWGVLHALPSAAVVAIWPIFIILMILTKTGMRGQRSLLEGQVSGQKMAQGSLQPAL